MTSSATASAGAHLPTPRSRPSTSQTSDSDHHAVRRAVLRLPSANQASSDRVAKTFRSSSAKPGSCWVAVVCRISRSIDQ